MVTTIEEKNRMIAEFMGISIDKTGSADSSEWIYLMPQEYGTKYQSTYSHEMKFHTSWDWLIPVMAKVYSESSTLSDTRKFRLSHVLLSYHTAVTENNIEFAHKHVFDAVQLINEEKEKVSK